MHALHGGTVRHVMDARVKDVAVEQLMPDKHLLIQVPTARCEQLTVAGLLLQAALLVVQRRGRGLAKTGGA